MKRHPNPSPLLSFFFPSGHTVDYNRIGETIEDFFQRVHLNLEHASADWKIPKNLLADLTWIGIFVLYPLSNFRMRQSLASDESRIIKQIEAAYDLIEKSNKKDLPVDVIIKSDLTKGEKIEDDISLVWVVHQYMKDRIERKDLFPRSGFRQQFAEAVARADDWIKSKGHKVDRVRYHMLGAVVSTDEIWPYRDRASDLTPQQLIDRIKVLVNEARR